MTNPATTTTVREGATVVVEPKNPFKSTATWGLILVAVNYGIQRAIDAGYLPEAFRQTVGDAATEIIVFVVGVLAMYYGRWRATRPLGFGDGPILRRVSLLLLALPLVAGCYSRAEHVAWRDGFYAGSAPIRDEHREWAMTIAGDFNRDGRVDATDDTVAPVPVPDLTALPPASRDVWLGERLRTHRELADTYEQDRSHDRGAFGTP